MSFIANLVGQAKRQKSMYENIDKQLVQINEKNLASTAHGVILRDVIRKLDAEDKFQEKDSLLGEIEGLLRSLPQTHNDILAKHAAESWDEATNYRRWLNKVVRWVAGVFIAISLYSVFVFLSDWSCDNDGELELCWHIPVKEWLDPSNINNQ